MRVSVIFTCFNRAEFIREAIDSALHQSVAPDEIIVVDDGSSDGSQDVVRSYANRGVRLIEQPNSGPSTARNKGINAAKSEYILLVDSDDMLLPHCVETLTTLFEQHPTAGLVHGLCQNFNQETGEDMEHPEFTMACLDEAPHETLPDGVRVYPNTFSQMLHGSFLPVGGTLVPKRVFRDVGMWDETIWTGGDREIWMRIVRKYASVFKPVEVMRRRFHSDNLSIGNQLRRADTNVRIARKAAGWPEISAEDADHLRFAGRSALRMLVRHHIGRGEGQRAREYLDEYGELLGWKPASMRILSYVPGPLLRMLNSLRGNKGETRHAPPGANR